MPNRPGEKALVGQEHVRIERADLRDLPEVEELMRACAGAPQWPADAWQKLLQQQPEAGDRTSVLLLARAPHGELIGWLAANRVYETAELEYVLVHPAHRRRGVAQQLTEHWLASARAEGASQALLEVRPSNQSAVRLYDSLGFVEQGRRRAYYREPDEDALLMAKALSL